MARTQATNRTAATNGVAATNRSAVSAYRIPMFLTGYGMTNYWDFRTGYTGEDSTSVQDMISGLNMDLREADTATAYTTGQYSVLLDGADDALVSADAIPPLSATQISYGAWVRVESNPPQNGGIFGMWTGNANRRSSLLTFRNTIRTALDVRFWLSEDGIGNGHSTTTSTIDFSTFHSIVATYNAGTTVIYIDGVSVAKADSSVPTTINDPGGPALTIGNWLNASAEPGALVNATFGHCFRADGATLTAAQTLDWHNWSKDIQGL